MTDSDSSRAHLSFNGSNILQLVPDLSVLDFSVLNLYKPTAHNHHKLVTAFLNASQCLACDASGVHCATHGCKDLQERDVPCTDNVMSCIGWILCSTATVLVLPAARA